MTIRALIAALAVSLIATPATRGQGPGPSEQPARPALPRPLGPPILGEPASRAAVHPSRVIPDLFQPAAPAGGVFIVRADWPRLRPIAGGFVISGFPLDAARRVDLEVERFWVTQASTRFVAGAGAGRPDQPLAFDPDSVVLLRGRVAGEPRSVVYLGLAPEVSNGFIDFGPGRGQYGVSSRGRSGPLAPGLLSVFQGAGGGASPIVTCLMHTPDHPVPPSAQDTMPVRGLRQLQLAAETDYEFFQLFGAQAATAAYLVELYGAVSDVYMRELKVRIDLTYARVWPTPTEPFNASLSEFQSYWQANMGAVQRDTAQMFSGRADLPGGVAYVGALCGSGAYSFCGNAVGYFADPATSSVFNYDPMVTAHELGHNCGSQHTDYYGLDNCGIVNSTPQRGTIMSYCNQTISGGMGNIDMGFHKVTRDAILQYLSAIPACVPFDCNQNGIADYLDIAAGVSADANGNGIPDECEDCNHNGILDTVDLAMGTSRDLNNNGIPDECEPDCNNNSIPDDRDILLGTSQDLHGDNIPDECDADLNHNGQSDYNEFCANMPLDKDRNRILDDQQDCDADGIPDLTALEGAWDGWAASLASDNAIREYHSITGVLMRTSQAGRVNQAQDLVITPDRRILVSSGGDHKVVEFDRTGAYVRDLVAAGSGGLSQPAGMVIAPWGNLLVCSRGTNSVLEYNIGTGAFVRAFVAPGAGGLASPFALTFKPGGDLFVTSGNTQVLEFNRTTGAFVRIFVTAAGNGGLNTPRGMVFKPTDGNLLVTSFATDQVKQYDGATGAFISNWQVAGIMLDQPWGLRIGPDGLVYMSQQLLTDTHVTRARILIFDIRNGNFIRAYVQANDSNLTSPTGFDFMPGNLTDCNHNQLPDSCDIASGRSSDINHNGIPDECEGLCYANCDLSTTPPILNVNDFICFQTKYAAGDAYANCDGSTVPPVLNVNDFICFQTRYARGCP